jgi:hypothetical protein
MSPVILNIIDLAVETWDKKLPHVQLQELLFQEVKSHLKNPLVLREFSKHNILFQVHIYLKPGHHIEKLFSMLRREKKQSGEAIYDYIHMSLYLV